MDTITIEWDNGCAELNLCEWFPATRERLSRLHKLLCLDCMSARAHTTQILAHVQSRLEQETERHKDLYHHYKSVAQQRATTKAQYESRKRPNGAPSSPAELETMRKELSQLRKSTDFWAAEVRRTRRNIEWLRQNSAAIKYWKF